MILDVEIAGNGYRLTHAHSAVSIVHACRSQKTALAAIDAPQLPTTPTLQQHAAARRQWNKLQSRIQVRHVEPVGAQGVGSLGKRDVMNAFQLDQLGGVQITSLGVKAVDDGRSGCQTS